MIRHGLRTTTDLLIDTVDYGPSAGDAVVLLHGYADSRRAFEPMIARMPATIRRVAFSHRGHGDSDKPMTGYRIDDLADDLAAVMDGLDIGRAVLVGHSMGSLVATRYALTNKARIAGLVLVGGFATLHGNAIVETLWRETVASLADPVDPAMVRDFQRSTLARPVSSSFLDRVVAESLKLPARGWRQILRGLLDEDFSRALTRITAPALLIRGDRDAISDRAEQRRLQAFLPGADLVSIADGGHSPHWEQPARIARLVTGFTRRTLPRAAAIGGPASRLALPRVTTYVA